MSRGDAHRLMDKRWGQRKHQQPQAQGPQTSNLKAHAGPSGPSRELKVRKPLPATTLPTCSLDSTLELSKENRKSQIIIISQGEVRLQRLCKTRTPITLRCCVFLNSVHGLREKNQLRERRLLTLQNIPGIESQREVSGGRKIGSPRSSSASLSL